MKEKLLVIGGPTSVGKTETSINIAKKLNGEIISADSMQIYKYMDIGSAKVTKEEMRGIKHHMIDIIDPKVNYSVSNFMNEGKKVLKNIINNKKLPIIAGGTGLYINSLIYKMDFTEAKKDDDYRNHLENLAKTYGNHHVHEMLKDIDIKSYNEIHMNNLKRVIRALEVYKITKKPFSEFNIGSDMYNSDYNIHYFVLTMNREKLYERINKRVDIMIENGLLEECIALKSMGYNSSMQSMQGIGYKEILYYLEGKCSLKDSIDMIKQGSRNYAKRQLTWFKRDKKVKFLDKDILTQDEIESIIIKDMKN